MWVCPHCIKKEIQAQCCYRDTCVYSAYRTKNLSDFILHMYTEHGDEPPKGFPLPPGTKRGKVKKKKHKKNG